MAHKDQTEFVAWVKSQHPEFFQGTQVLEVGSRNINGSVRDFFAPDCWYVGIDCTDGPGVDVVTLAHEFDWRGDPFDVVISCEAFEHDPYLQKTIDHVLSMLRDGGLFVATMASPNRKEHGTRRASNPEGIFGPDPDYYKGISTDCIMKMLGPYMLEGSVRGEKLEDNLDTYVSMIKQTPPDDYEPWPQYKDLQCP